MNDGTLICANAIKPVANLGPTLFSEEAEEQPEEADKSLEAAQREDRIREVMKELPEEQAEMVRLAFFEDKAHSAIAEATGLPLGTVKSRLRLALAKLRAQLEEE